VEKKPDPAKQNDSIFQSAEEVTIAQFSKIWIKRDKRHLLNCHLLSFVEKEVNAFQD